MIVIIHSHGCWTVICKISTTWHLCYVRKMDALVTSVSHGGKFSLCFFRALIPPKVTPWMSWYCRPEIYKTEIPRSDLLHGCESKQSKVYSSKCCIELVRKNHFLDVTLLFSKRTFVMDCCFKQQSITHLQYLPYLLIFIWECIPFDLY